MRMIMEMCSDLLEWAGIGPGDSANCPGAWPTREGVNMSDLTCSVEGCSKPIDTWGWCELHYRRWRRTGDPIIPLPIPIDQIPDPALLCDPDEDVEVLARFWSKVDVGDCWEWTAGKTKAGYGEFCKDSKNIYAHRQSYGMVVDHLCRKPPCLNPDHLRVVTDAFNKAVGYSPVAIQTRSAACPNGHNYTPENTFYRGRHRRCRACVAADGISA